MAVRENGRLHIAHQDILLAQPSTDSPALLAARERWQHGIQREMAVACDHLRAAAAALNALGSRSASIEFTRLKALVGATDGNLGAHLETLEKAGYIVIEKRFEDRKPQTRVRMSPAGRRAFAEHVAYLREIIDDAGA